MDNTPIPTFSSNILKTISMFTPIIFLIMVIVFGLFSGSFAALCIFLVSMMIMHVIISFAGNTIFSVKDFLHENDKCKLFTNSSIPFMEADANMTVLSPSGSVFTLIYVLGSMFANDNVNMFLIVIMLSLFVNSLYHVGLAGCMDMNFRFMALSAPCAIAMVVILFAANSNDFLLFSSGSSNNTQCGRVKGQRFKCKVYKNGQLIS
jgi:hypothetical protein